jgi:hypothetical protein
MKREPRGQLSRLERSCTHETHLQHYNKAQRTWIIESPSANNDAKWVART